MSKQPTQKSGNPADGGGNPEPKGYEKTIARWTVVLGASTIALVIATGLSGYFLYTTDETIKKQVEAAGIQLRAYVNYQQVVYIPHFSKDPDQKDAPEPGAHFGVTWKNYGSTPAREASYWISVKWYANGTEPDFSKPTEILTDHPNTTIPPGGERATVAVFVPIADINKTTAVSSGKIFLWGHISYKDYIPGSPIRNSHFCLVAVTLPAVATQPAAFNVYKPDCNYTD
jgi:hypothetical protein